MGESDALVTSLLGGGVAVGLIRLLLTAASAALERRKDRQPDHRRTTAMMDDYEGLVDRLQHQVELLQAEMHRMAGRITTLEASEARLQVELTIARETHKLQLERVYTELEQTRIRLAAVERENTKLRGLVAPEEGQE